MTIRCSRRRALRWAPTRQFEAAGLERKHWSTAAPIRAIFREAFAAAGLPYFNPHSFRNTLVQLGQTVCQTPEEFKAWSQNLGHEGVLTTFSAMGRWGAGGKGRSFGTGYAPILIASRYGGIGQGLGSRDEDVATRKLAERRARCWTNYCRRPTKIYFRLIAKTFPRASFRTDTRSPSASHAFRFSGS